MQVGRFTEPVSAVENTSSVLASAICSLFTNGGFTWPCGILALRAEIRWEVIASQVVQGQSYIWAFRYAVIFVSGYTVLMFFLCPETTYNRSKRYDTDVRETLAGESDSESTDGEPAANEKHLVAVDVTEPDATVERKISYWQLLKVYNGRFSNEKYVRAVISPFATFMLPGISWAAYTYGCSVAFSDALSVCLSQIFTKPPYNFFTSSVGLTILLLFAANIIGNFVPGPVSDWIVTSMSSENNGVYEPEFRNILSIPALITGLAGYWEFGLAIHHRVHWFVPVFLFALAGFSGSILSLISNTYLLDCHRKYAQDGYAAVTLVKAVMTFAITFFVNSWLLNSGPVQVFFVIGTIHGIGCIWGIVLYIFGKRIHLAVHKNKSIQGSLREFGNAD